MEDVILTHVHGEIDHGMATKLMTAEPTWVCRLQPSSPKEDTNYRTQQTSEDETDEDAPPKHSSTEEAAFVLSKLRDATEGPNDSRSFPSDTVASPLHGKTSEIKTGEPMRILHFRICLAMQRHQWMKLVGTLIPLPFQSRKEPLKNGKWHCQSFKIQLTRRK